MHRQDKFHAIFTKLSLLALVLFTATACTPYAVGGLQTGGSQKEGTLVASGETSSVYSIYFTEPHAGKLSYRGGPDEALAQAIEQARLSVDVAAYQLGLWSIRDALLDAHQRGVAVRVVTESDNLDGEEIQQIQQAGIPVLGDRREGLMHNKFVVIDQLETWTGSMNLTLNGAYRNDNNLLRLRSSRLAQDYTTEFEEMFVEDKFGPGSPANTPYPELSIDGMQVEVLFSPDDGVAERLVELVQGAQESVLFLAYSFTSDDLALAMIDRARSGVRVAGVMEANQYRSNMGTEYDRLRKSGVQVRLDGNPNRMHHKVLIVDGRVVVTGSYNFSQSAETRNDENTLVIHSPELAQAFVEEFERVYKQGKGE